MEGTRPGRDVLCVLRRPNLVAALLIAASVLSGCGGGDSDGSDGGDAAADATSASSSVRSSSTTTRPSTTTESTAPAEPADGTNLAACADRTCEVWVRPGDVIRFEPQFIANEFQAESVSGNRFSFVVFDDQPSPLEGWIGGTGNADISDVHFDLVRLEGDRAFLRFRPR
jgi:hypothetical protein